MSVRPRRFQTSVGISPRIEVNMREMRPNPDRGFPSKYTCSDCSWSFPLERLSELADFFQQKAAILAFSTHSCASFPSIQKAARPEDYSHLEDVPRDRGSVDEP